LITEFEDEYYKAQKRGISLNLFWILFNKRLQYNISDDLVLLFTKHEPDLIKSIITVKKSMMIYIYGSADVVGTYVSKSFL
jgi:hypothetical protein